MLYQPSSNTRSSRGLFGIVTTSGQTGPHMRRLSFPKKSGSPTVQAWRNIFLSAKQNWLALGEGGSDYVFTGGVAPQQAWQIMADLYFGIMQAPVSFNGVVIMGFLVGCSGAEAFYQMCQTNRASLGLAPLAAPEIITSYLALAASPQAFSKGAWTVSFIGPDVPSSSIPQLNFTVYFDQYPLPAAPFDFSASSADCSVEVSEVFLDYVTTYGGEVIGSTATSTPTTITFSFSTFFSTDQLIGSLINSTGYSPAGYNLVDAVIVANDSTSITVSVSADPGVMSIAGTAVLTQVLSSRYSASLIASPYSSTVPGALTVAFAFADAYGTYSDSINLTAEAGSPAPNRVPPFFSYPSNMFCTVVLDSEYSVTGFWLTYATVEGYLFPMFSNGVTVPGVWKLSASPTYKTGYSFPDASGWAPILFVGPFLPTPAQVLSAVVATFGALPASGSIKFQLQYIDPDTGCSGPPLSATGTWAAGTLRGSSLALWSGPLWEFGPTKEWNPTDSYVYADIAFYDYLPWFALLPSTNVAPSESAYWTQFVGFPWLSDWTFVANEQVIYSGTSWRALKASTGQVPSHSQYWQESPFGGWNSSTQYFVGMAVLYDTKTWTALLDNLNVTPSEGAAWTNAVPSSVPQLQAPGVFMQRFYVSPVAGYTGTIAFKLLGKTKFITTTPPAKAIVPQGVSAIFDPPTVTFVPGENKTITTVMTLTAEPGCFPFSGDLKVQGSDTILTRSAPFTFSIVGDTSPAPDLGGLAVGVSAWDSPLPAPGVRVIPIVVANTLSEDLPVTMSANAAAYYYPPGFDLSDPPFTMSFDVTDFVIAAGSIASPASVTVNLTVTAVSAFITLGVIVAVNAVSGVYKAQVPLYLA